MPKVNRGVSPQALYVISPHSLPGRAAAVTGDGTLSAVSRVLPGIGHRRSVESLKLVCAPSRLLWCVNVEGMPISEYSEYHPFRQANTMYLNKMEGLWFSVKVP